MVPIGPGTDKRPADLYVPASAHSTDKALAIDFASVHAPAQSHVDNQQTDKNPLAAAKMKEKRKTTELLRALMQGKEPGDGRHGL